MRMIRRQSQISDKIFKDRNRADRDENGVTLSVFNLLTYMPHHSWGEQFDHSDKADGILEYV